MEPRPASRRPATGTSRFEHRQLQIEAESRRDRRALRLAVALAVVLHLGLFGVRFPEIEAEVPPPEPERAVYVIQPVRFKPPPPPVEPTPPRREEIRSVPVPDPTPDELEPIRPIEPLPTVEPLAFDLPVVIPQPPAPPAPPPAPAETGPLHIAGAVVPPVKISGAEPRYTEIARRTRVTGTVLLHAVIDEEGRVTSIEVRKGLPGGLDRAAVEALSGWRFRPATLHGRPVAVYYDLEIRFDLQ